MATIQLTIPDDKLDLVIDTLCARGGYQDEVPDPEWIDPEDGSTRPNIPNPMGKPKFARKQLLGLIRNEVVQFTANQLVKDQNDTIALLRDSLADIDEA